MRHCKIIRDKNLVCFVFPSLSLIEQFNRDYLSDFQNKISISSESDSTTNTATIKKFLSSKKQKKIVCVTFQSFDVLLAVLTQLDKKIDVCIFDEAHHAVGETYQQLIFGNDVCLKQVFMTATPKNANGITMYDRFNVDAGMCGRLVYDYSYLDGLMGEYLNPFEIRVDLYSENVNRSIYESIARAVLVSGNNRVLTFHSDVNTDRETSVNNFVDLSLFRESFDKVVCDEFGKKAGHYRSVEIVGLSSDISMVERKAILARLDTLPHDEILVIASCETIGEGIDTKNANMCVFVDPKQSFVKIIQNIGRVVRRQAMGSTILIPCWVDREKYLECGDDAEKCDAVIREDMQSTGGNFNGILNVMSALKQEDEDIYDVCLHYPDAFSYEEIEAHLGGQGYKILESVGDGELFENLEYLVKGEDSDEDLDANDYEDMDEDELIMAVGENHDLRVEIYSTSLDEPVEVVNSEGESTIRLYRSVNEDTDEVVYCPIVSNSNEKKNKEKVKAPSRINRPSFSVHTNPDVQVLWKIRDEDLNGKMGSCVIDCQTVKYDAMEQAKEIVERGILREQKGGKKIPRDVHKKYRTTTDLELEHKDASKLQKWKMALKGSKNSVCCEKVKTYLDNYLIGWRENFDEKAMKFAQSIVERGLLREKSGGKKIPHQIHDKFKTTNDLKQEHKDAMKLYQWRMALKEKKGSCPIVVKNFLDIHLQEWSNEINLETKAMKLAQEIVERGILRERNGGRRKPIQNGNKSTPELLQEYKDANKLNNWKKSLNGKRFCPIEVKEYLNIHIPNWCNDLEEEAMKFAQAIVERGILREQNGGIRKPMRKEKTTPELDQEYKDATKLSTWKLSLKGKGGVCPNKVKEYLNIHIPNWCNDLEEEAMKSAQAIVKRGILREQNGGTRKPKKTENKTTPELLEEYKDANKLAYWKKALKGKGRICPNSIKEYLDINIPEWRDETDFEEEAMKFAKAIVERGCLRYNINKNKIPKSFKIRNTPDLEQEYKDCCKLKGWKMALKGSKNTICPNSVKKYLDLNLPGWRKEEQQTSTKSMELKPTTTKEPNNKKKKAPQPLPEISQLHQKYKTLNSNNLHTLFKENPQLFEEYHTLSENNEKTFPQEEIPRNRIIAELDTIKTKRIIKIADLGCGKAHIAQHYNGDPRFQFHNYDHISTKSTIESCDISTLPLEDNTIEICILSLAMWGSNCTDYLREAKRVLETNGRLYIIEATKRWTDDETLPAGRLRKAVEDAGFEIRKSDIKKFTMFVCE
jgi:superfamily II DNA or RNA helicase